MTDHEDSVTAAIEAALALADPDDLIRGVKTAVAQELEVLSPDSTVAFTSYFNHSYMADLIVTWGSGASAVTRPVYLRGALRPTTAGDVDALAPLEPMVVGLRRPVGPSVNLGALRSRAIAAPRVLVTDMPAVSRLVAPRDDNPPDAAPADDNASASRTPLLQLVQANFVRGGRGLVGSEEVQQLTGGAATAPTNALSNDTLRAFQVSAGELFVEDAALRLRRAAEVLRRGFVEENEPSDDAVPLEGRLSEVELRVLIPYLLRLDRVNLSPAYWRTLGAMMDLEMLEALWAELAGIDVTPLVVPNLATWTAKRAQLSLNAAFDDNPTQEDTGDTAAEAPAVGELVESDGNRGHDEARGPWRVLARGLAAEVGPWRAWFATDSRRLRGRDDGIAARWTDLQPHLRDYQLASVELLGVTRRITVSTRTDDGVEGDVTAIGGTIGEEFHVEDVSVRVSERDDAPVIDVALTKMIATARSPETVANLLAVSLDVLGHRRPVDYAHLLDWTTAAEVGPEPTGPASTAPRGLRALTKNDE